MNTKSYLIGEFSQASHVSKRMLRHFENLGLLMPEFIDESNSYRYYSQSQLATISKIKYLQDFGFTLKKIKDLISDSLTIEEFLDALKDQEAILRNDKDEKTRHLLKLQSFITYVEENPSQKDAISHSTFEIERSTHMQQQTYIKERLSQLPSITIFNEKLEESSKSNPHIPIYFITFDIDNFMYINDDFGYNVGDNVIYKVFDFIEKGFENLLQKNVHNMLARFGGDEFVLYLMNPNHDQVLETVTTTLDSISGYDYTELGCKKKVTSSCGIAKINNFTHPQDYRHISTKALIEAKRAGKNSYLFLQK